MGMAPAKTIALTLAAALCLVGGSAHAWRSSLYPEAWTPGFADADGRFLHDFSAAGYRAGATGLPDDPPGPVVDATAPPYGAVLRISASRPRGRSGKRPKQTPDP